MKKLLLIASALFVFATVNAQEAPKADKQQPTKEEKQKMKEKQEADIAAAFKEIGLSEEQIQKVKAVMDETSKKNNEVRKNETMTEEQKKETMKANNDEKNSQIKEIMGEDKYKQFNTFSPQKAFGRLFKLKYPAGGGIFYQYIVNLSAICHRQASEHSYLLPLFVSS